MSVSYLVLTYVMCFTSLLLSIRALMILQSNMYVCIYVIHSFVFSLEGQAWQEPEPSHVTGMAVAHCILGKFLEVVCHCIPPPLDVPTLAARCLRPQRGKSS